MTAVLRPAYALGLLLTLASHLFAVPTTVVSEANYWMEPCRLPTIRESSELFGTSPVQLASATEATIEISEFTEPELDEECYDLSDCCCPSKWSVRAGAVFLHRSRPDNDTFITPPTGTPGKVVDGADFEFDWDIGVDVSIARRLDNGLIVEARYFNTPSSEANFLVPQITIFRTAGIGVTILGGGSLDSFYKTALESGELNLQKPLGPGLSLLAGFRWIDLQDDLRSNIASPATFVVWEEHNKMFGGQLGANMALTSGCNPLQFNAFIKAGAYHNEMENRFRSTIVGGTVATESDLSFAGELGFTAAYFITPHIALRGGYEVLWLENVAIASESASTTTQVAGGTSSPVGNGFLWYHGATAAVEVVW